MSKQPLDDQYDDARVIRKYNPGTRQSDEELIAQFVVRLTQFELLMETINDNLQSDINQHLLVIGPRGRGKTPDAAIPNEQTTESGLRELLSEASMSAQKATESDCDCWWKHFAFGVMKRDEALKFVEIHNKHHLKIISDILSNNSQGN